MKDKMLHGTIKQNTTVGAMAVPDCIPFLDTNDKNQLVTYSKPNIKHPEGNQHFRRTCPGKGNMPGAPPVGDGIGVIVAAVEKGEGGRIRKEMEKR
jgi:hypothetical protein